jgi:hypothetical protein
MGVGVYRDIDEEPDEGVRLETGGPRHRRTIIA